MVFEARFLIASKRLFQSRQLLQLSSGLGLLLHHREEALAGALQPVAESSLASAEAVVRANEAVEETGQFLRAVGKFRNLVLAVDLDIRKHSRRGNVEYVPAIVVAHDRRVREGSLDSVLPQTRSMRAHDEGDLRPVPHDLAHNAFVNLAGFLSKRY